MVVGRGRVVADTPVTGGWARWPSLEAAYLDLTRNDVEYRGTTVTAIAAEWAKFRTVRGWVIAVVAAAAVSHRPGPDQRHARHLPRGLVRAAGRAGRGGGHRQLLLRPPAAGRRPGTVAARLDALTGQLPAPGGAGTRRGLVPWAKAGIIVQSSLRPGSAYAAMMVTGGHGVRLQYDYTGDIAAPAIRARWLRLVRHGHQVTGYESADGARSVRGRERHLPGGAVQAGLFATSPQYSATSLGSAEVSGGPSQATGVFGTGPAERGRRCLGGLGHRRQQRGGVAGPSAGYRQGGGTFTVTGTGDIAPAVAGAAGLGVTIAQTLLGMFLALIVLVVVGAMFVRAEYRRGLIGK